MSIVLGVDVHAGAGLQGVGDDQADDERQRRNHLEIDQRLEADAADLLHVLHAGDAMHDGAEDDRRDDHLDRLDEGIAQRLHLLAELRIVVPEQDAHHDRGQHLDVEAVDAAACSAGHACTTCAMRSPSRAPAFSMRGSTAGGARGQA